MHRDDHCSSAHTVRMYVHTYVDKFGQILLPYRMYSSYKCITTYLPNIVHACYCGRYMISLSSTTYCYASTYVRMSSVTNFRSVYRVKWIKYTGEVWAMSIWRKVTLRGNSL